MCLAEHVVYPKLSHPFSGKFTGISLTKPLLHTLESATRLRLKHSAQNLLGNNREVVICHLEEFISFELFWDCDDKCCPREN